MMYRLFSSFASNFPMTSPCLARDNRPVRRAVRRAREGFTLIEVTVFLLVSVLAVGGIFNLFNFALRSVQRPGQEARALLLARERLEQIHADRARLGYEAFIQTLNNYGPENPVAGAEPLTFAEFRREVAFAPAAVVSQELRCGGGAPLPLADLLCFTVTVRPASGGEAWVVLSSVVTRHE